MIDGVGAGMTDVESRGGLEETLDCVGEDRVVEGRLYGI